MGARILVVDNYDSFVYNLVQYLAQLGAEPDVRRNDVVSGADVEGFDGVLLSPGPGTPEKAGACVELVGAAVDAGVPLLGVCLGHQAIGVAYGATVGPAPELLHGKTSQVLHDGAGVLAGQPSPFTATRYHSLAVDPDSVPAELEVTAWTAGGVIMAVRYRSVDVEGAMRHRDVDIEGVQFHPESVLTDGGHRMLGTWLARCGEAQAPERALRLAAVRSAR